HDRFRTAGCGRPPRALHRRRHRDAGRRRLLRTRASDGTRGGGATGDTSGVRRSRRCDPPPVYGIQGRIRPRRCDAGRRRYGYTQRVMKYLCVVTIATVGIAFASASARVSADTYVRQPGIRIAHYTFDITVGDADNEIVMKETVNVGFVAAGVA